MLTIWKKEVDIKTNKQKKLIYEVLIKKVFQILV